MKLKLVLRVLLAVFMVVAGGMHFWNPEPFVRIVPPFLPAPLAIVYASGVFEILGGLGLLVPATRSAAAWGLVLLFIAVFPANIYMAIYEIPMGDTKPPTWALWLRLPLQFVLIAWAYWNTRKHDCSSRKDSIQGG